MEGVKMICVKYCYMDADWHLICTSKVYEYIETEYNDFFNPANDQNIISFEIELVMESTIPSPKFLKNGQICKIHNSNKEGYDEIGSFFDEGLLRSVYNYTTKSIITINYLNNKIKIYNKDISMLLRDAIRITRDTLKTFIEIGNENVAMYHASAIVDKNNECIVFMGDKGVGKSTLLLSFTDKKEYKELSKDKVFIRQEGTEFKVFGWPTYYNFQVKTLLEFKKLKDFIPHKYRNLSLSDVNDLTEKVSVKNCDIEIERYRNAAYLSKIILLTKNKEIDFEIDTLLAKNCYSPNDTYSTNWMNFPVNTNDIVKNSIELSHKLKNDCKIVLLEVDNDKYKTINNIINLIERKK
jgi:GTPase SAR1 family protein